IQESVENAATDVIEPRSGRGEQPKDCPGQCLEPVPYVRRGVTNSAEQPGDHADAGVPEPRRGGQELAKDPARQVDEPIPDSWCSLPNSAEQPTDHADA